jgi:cob(I)alamin adenosyltransferase
MGYLHIYTGNGKGKTTCALGLLMRAVGAGWPVAFLQFDKGFEGKNEHYHERAVLRQFPGVDLLFYGLERMQADGKFRFANVPGDLEQAQAGLEAAAGLVEKPKHKMVILDEIVTCIGTGLLTETDLLSLISKYREMESPCELILTGRGATEQLIAAADLVTEMSLVKHYWYSHKQDAREGVEY